MRRSRPLLTSYFAYFDPCPTNTSTESSESTRSRVFCEDSVEVLRPTTAALIRCASNELLMIVTGQFAR